MFKLHTSGPTTGHMGRSQLASQLFSYVFWIVRIFLV